MLYLNNTTQPQTVRIPKIDLPGTCALYLHIKCEMEKTERVIEVEDSGEYQQYYVITLTLPEDAQPGEYEYSLSDGETTLSEGILEIFDDNVSVEYDQITDYMQYGE